MRTMIFCKDGAVLVDGWESKGNVLGVYKESEMEEAEREAEECDAMMFYPGYTTQEVVQMVEQGKIWFGPDEEYSEKWDDEWDEPWEWEDDDDDDWDWEEDEDPEEDLAYIEEELEDW